MEYAQSIINILAISLTYFFITGYWYHFGRVLNEKLKS